MHELNVATLEEIAFNYESHEHIDGFVEKDEGCEAQESPRDVRYDDFADRDAVKDHCLNVDEAGDVGDYHC